jgi:hypothetical protein
MQEETLKLAFQLLGAELPVAAQITDVFSTYVHHTVHAFA